LELYNNAAHTAYTHVLRKQLFDKTRGTFGTLVRSKCVLIVEEVNNTHATLQYAVEEL